MHFAIFPKKGGRPCEEPTDEQWKELGRLLARVHQVGAEHPPRDRITLHPTHASETHLREILATEFRQASLKREFEREAREILDLIRPLFDDAEFVRIHGDCHPANIIHRPGEGFHLIDFDDMAWGPPVQDLWMLLPGHVRQVKREVDLLLDGYEMFREFEYGSLKLIEPLRAMRFLHFTAWCAHQKADGGFSRLAPDWGSDAFWKREITDLNRQKQEILDALDGNG